MISTQRHPSSRAPGGFTLIELLVVIAIVAIIAAIAVPALTGTMSSVNLKGGADILSGQLDLARETASAQNVSVDFRIYQDPSEKDLSGNATYRLIALAIPAEAGSGAPDQFVTAPIALPAGVIIDPDTTFSSLLNPNASTTLPPVQGTESATAPALVQGKSYIKFTFQPNGSLNLDGSVTWTLTLINKNLAKPTNGGPAANYVTLTLDPVTAHARTYQP